MEGPAQQKLFPLEPDRLRAEIKIIQSGRAYRLTHIFSPISEQQWIEYGAKVDVAIVTQKESSTTEYRTAEAVEWLWSEAIQEIEGYGDPRPDNWRELVPINHKDAAIEGLTQTSPGEEDEAGRDEEDEGVRDEEDEAGRDEEETRPFLLGQETERVVLEASRNGEIYKHLIHIFQTPTTKQRTEYNRRLAATRRIRGRRGKGVREVIQNQMPYLCRIYGELISAVEGYDPADPKKMDAQHKRAAITSLLGNE